MPSRSWRAAASTVTNSVLSTVAYRDASHLQRGEKRASRPTQAVHTLAIHTLAVHTTWLFTPWLFREPPGLRAARTPHLPGAPRRLFPSVALRTGTGRTGEGPGHGGGSR